MCFLVYAITSSNKTTAKKHHKKTALSTLTDKKADSVFVRYDSIDGEFAGADYYLYYDTIQINVIVTTHTIVHEGADTMVFINGKNGRLFKLEEDVDKEIKKKLLNS